MSNSDHTTLGAWLNPPVMQDRVVAFLIGHEKPVLVSEVAAACSMSVQDANKILYRLYYRGWLNRHQIPVQRHRCDARNRRIIPGGATRMLWLYTMAESE